jgi:hypothetical protein
LELIGDRWTAMVRVEWLGDLPARVYLPEDFSDRDAAAYSSVWNAVEKSYSKLAERVNARLREDFAAHPNSAIPLPDGPASQFLKLEAIAFETNGTVVLHWGLVPRGAPEPDYEVLASFEDGDVKILGIGH